MCEKNFYIYGVHIPRKCIESRHFYSCPRSLLALQTEFFENLFPQQQKGVEKAMIGFIKIQSENMKMAWNIRLFIFCIICNFSKCDEFTVL